MSERDKAGLFGPESVAWRLHADPTMLIAAMRALLVQALEPRTMAGVDQHSDYQVDPWKRLDRTVRFILATTYGDTATAEAATAAVRRVHERVRGVDPVTGRAYSADDPDLILWVHAAEIHSVVIAYRRYAARLSDADADRYVAEMARVAELVGLPPGMAPRTMGDLRDYLRGMHNQLQLTPPAQAAMRTIFSPPMPLPLRPLWVVPVTATIAVLPRVARRLYGLPWLHPATPSVRMGMFGLTRMLNVVFPDAPEVRKARERVRAA
ncbi:MAG TPA: oxygenase MpaB family protein [Acidimicrobiia bacterium]|nr:oxygenase MpaB family protein [Acidimicrobiia bacterium]